MSCFTLGVDVCDALYIVYVHVLYNVMGQEGMGLPWPLFCY